MQVKMISKKEKVETFASSCRLINFVQLLLKILLEKE